MLFQDFAPPIIEVSFLCSHSALKSCNHIANNIVAIKKMAFSEESRSAELPSNESTTEDVVGMLISGTNNLLHVKQVL